jgi:ABC-type polysaccharide/polyol phosphate transport system ATPase subunit
MNNLAIQVNNVSKYFKIYKNPVTDPVKEIIFFWKRQKFYRKYTAVNQVSLEIKRGEVLGIIGANGAGKTTLLKMLAGLLPVDSGEIIIRGKITALLALGVGVHPEFTGRENIIYSGMLLGMSRQEILSKLENIIEFAELGQYIDYPFRTYSSGMKARLLFATSVSIDPDILIVDEALATGDIAFVQKCSQRIQEICRSGATVIFVSHSLEQIEQLCPRCLVMQRGNLIFDGDTHRALNIYINSIYQDRAEAIRAEMSLSNDRKFRGTGEIQIEEVNFYVNGQATETVIIGQSCELRITINSMIDLPRVKLCIEAFSEKSPITYAYFPSLVEFIEDRQNQNNFSLKAGYSTIIIDIDRVTFGSGSYDFSIQLYPAREDYIFTYETSYCSYHKDWRFQVVYADPLVFGRNTLTEIPIRSIRAIHGDDRREKL